jgi:hypothetical protein
MKTTRKDYVFYVLAFVTGDGSRWYRFGACWDRDVNAVVAKLTNASPVPLARVYTATLPGFPYGALVDLLAQEALAGQHQHADWYRAEFDRDVLASISKACAPDQIVLDWEHGDLPARKTSKTARATVTSLRRARASVRAAHENAAFYGAQARPEPTTDDIRSAYRG